jgi:hypothetical protein
MSDIGVTDEDWKHAESLENHLAAVRDRVAGVALPFSNGLFLLLSDNTDFPAHVLSCSQEHL